MKTINKITALLFLLFFIVSCNSKVEDDIIEKEEIKPEVSEYTVYEALENKKKSHFKDEDVVYDASNMTTILFSENNAVINGDGASYNNKAVLISKPGVYHLSGYSADGRIIVDVDKEEKVQIVLDNIDITYKNGSPFFIKSCKTTTIILAENSDNYLSDFNNYIYDLPEDKEPNATLFGKDDFTICGTGKLTVTGKFNDAIGGKDGLVIKDAELSIYGVDDGMQIKDYLIVDNAKLKIKALDDGIKIFDDKDPQRGYFYMKSGEMNITSGGDGIQAETDLLISDGKITILSGEGHTFDNVEDLSLKGLKANDAIVIDGGSFVIDAADDALNSKGIISINGGVFDLSTGDDAMHANVALGVTDGEINVLISKDGLEGNIINIQGGDININALTDGLNILDEEEPELKSTALIDDQLKKSHLYIKGGKINITAMDDGVDAFDTFVMEGGKLIIHIPEGGDKALDVKENLIVKDGTIFATQPEDMILLPIENSEQNIAIINLKDIVNKETVLSIENDEGEIYSSSVNEKYKAFFFSMPDLKDNSEYKVFVDNDFQLSFTIADLYSFLE